MIAETKPVDQIKPKTPFWEYAFIVWICIFQTVSFYRMPGVPFFTIADVGIILIVIMLTLTAVINGREIKIFKPALIFFAFAVFRLAVDVWDADSDVILRTLRTMFSLMVVAVFVPTFFHRDIALPFVKKVAVVAALFAVAQFFLATFVGFHLSGEIPFLEVELEMEEVLLGFDGEIIEVVRFRAFFAEPGYLGLFLAVALACSLSEEKRRLRHYIPDLLMVTGIFVSVAATGMVMLMVVGGYWLLFSKHKKAALVLFAVTVVVILQVLFGFVGEIFERILVMEPNGELQLGLPVYNRLRHYGAAFDMLGLTPAQIMFGQGMVRPDVYIAGWGQLFVYYGAVGMVVYAAVHLYLVLTAKGYARVLAVCLIVMNVASNLMFGITPLFVMPFMIALLQKPMFRPYIRG